MSTSDAFGGVADRWKKIQQKKAAQPGDQQPADFNELFTLRARILGVLIRDARQTRQRTAADLATSLGIPEQTLLQWEFGIASPSLPQLELLAYDLGLPVSHFWGTETLSRSGEAGAFARQEYLLLRDRILGARLAQARADAGLAVEDLAARLNLPPEAITAYELGEESIPLSILTSLASATSVSVSYFLEQGNRIGQWLDQQEAFKRFSAMPEDVRTFISNPSNRSFVQLAMWFSALGVTELRGLAESILNLSRLEQDKMRRIAEGILNDITL